MQDDTSQYANWFKTTKTNSATESAQRYFTGQCMGLSLRNVVFTEPATRKCRFQRSCGQISVLVTAHPCSACEVVVASGPDDTASRAGHHLERQAITLGPQAAPVAPTTSQPAAGNAAR
jgi:hypothetical protein